MSLPHLIELHAALEAADSLSAVVHAGLRAALAIAGAQTEARHLLRASLHLRPASGYAGLFVLDAGATRLSTPRTEHRLLPSASAWQLARTRRRPVFVDVVHRRLKVWGDTTAAAVHWQPRRTDELTEASQRRLLGRDATHVCVLPIRHDAAVIGMLALELADLSAVGTDAIWPACVEALALVGALVAPPLTRLPARAMEPVAPDPLLPVIGPTMAPIVRVAEAFAREDETLLISGETGTGKSRLARWCHARSPRAQGAFEVLDLLAVPPEMQLGELFGWRRGAFTGAVSDHDGFVTRARGGTLFIDEIDKLSLDAQAGLLTLLEERTFRVLGARAPQAADVRFIIGTNVDLRAAVAAGRFREDLFYRLDVLSIALPALRERRDEIADWAAWMLAGRHAGAGRAGAARFTADALTLLEGRDWTGNLRALHNVVRRAYVVASLDGEGEVLIEARHLGGAGPQSAAPVTRPPAAAETLIERLADAHAALIERIAATGPLEGVDLAGALSGLALAEAVSHTGSRSAAMQLLGRGDLVRNRNHHKALRRDAERAAQLARWLDQPVPAAVEALLG